MKLVKPSGVGEVGFNMTAAISMIFNLLMFFVLTAQFQTLEIEDVTLPFSLTAEAKEYSDTESIYVNIVHPEAPVVVVGHQEISDADLTAYLIERHRSAGERGKNLNVILRADADVAYGDVARVMLAAGRAEIPGWWIEADISDASRKEQLETEGNK